MTDYFVIMLGYTGFFVFNLLPTDFVESAVQNFSIHMEIIEFPYMETSAKGSFLNNKTEIVVIGFFHDSECVASSQLELEGINGSERKYINWLLGLCLKEGVQPLDVFTESALDLMANQLSTPLQINSYTWKALARAHQIGQKPVEAETLQQIITQDLNGKEAMLHRYGYNMKSLSEAIDARPSEIRAYLHGHMGQGRSQEIQKDLLKLGIINDSQR